MALGVTNRPDLGGSSVRGLMTGGVDISKYLTPPRLNSGKDDWNNYMAAKDIQESLRPGSMKYGEVQQLPGESWNDWMDRKGLAENLFGGGLEGSYNLRSALDKELGVGYKPTKSLAGGGISYSGGGGGGGGGSNTLDFYMGKFPTLVKQDIPWQEAGKRVQEANQPFISEYEKATPGQEATLRNLSLNAGDLSAGKIPLSVLQASQRATAQAGYGSGLGVGGRASGIQRMRGARDIMSTSLDLMKQSAQIAATIPSILQGASQAKYQIAPTNVFDAFTSQASANTQLANQQLISDWMNQAKPGQFDITTGSFVGMQPGSRINPGKSQFNPYA